jgi:hypothetical protein
MVNSLSQCSVVDVFAVFWCGHLDSSDDGEWESEDGESSEDELEVHTNGSIEEVWGFMTHVPVHICLLK